MRIALENLEWTQCIAAALEPTLNYNEFHYTNLAVRQDGTEATMFDYNYYMGKSYTAADIRNVCASLSPEVAAALRAAYGSASAMEMQADRVIAALVTAALATRRQEFPVRANPSISISQTGVWKRICGGLTWLNYSTSHGQTQQNFYFVAFGVQTPPNAYPEWQMWAVSNCRKDYWRMAKNGHVQSVIATK